MMQRRCWCKAERNIFQRLNGYFSLHASCGVNHPPGAEEPLLSTLATKYRSLKTIIDLSVHA